MYFDNPINTSLWKQCQDTCDQYATNIIEPPHDKTNKMACAPSDPPSLIRVFAVRMKKAGIFTYPWAHSEDSDQTGRMPRLIWVFAGRTVILFVLSWGGSYEPRHEKTHPPSLIRVFAVRMKKAWVLSYPLSAQRRLRSDWADAQADLSLRWAHSHFVGFLMSRLNCVCLRSLLVFSSICQLMLFHECNSCSSQLQSRMNKEMNWK